jgi:hypothetical protein
MKDTIAIVLVILALLCALFAILPAKFDPFINLIKWLRRRKWQP